MGSVDPGPQLTPASAAPAGSGGSSSPRQLLQHQAPSGLLQTRAYGSAQCWPVPVTFGGFCGLLQLLQPQILNLLP